MSLKKELLIPNLIKWSVHRNTFSFLLNESDIVDSGLFRSTCTVVAWWLALVAHCVDTPFFYTPNMSALPHPCTLCRCQGFISAVSSICVLKLKGN